MNITEVIHRHRRLLLFCISGGLAFFVDFLIFLALGYMGLNLWVARLIAFLCAATFTWQFNRLITFRDRQARLKNIHGWASYMGLMLIGGVFNYAASMGLLLLMPPPSPLKMFFSVACGSLAGLLVNFTTSNLWFFNKKK